MSEKPKKHRPDISLRCPATVSPGEPFIATVSLETKAPVDVKWVTAELAGKMRGSVGSGDSRSSKRVGVCTLAARLCEERRLHKGINTFRASFTIPSGSPPSYRTHDARVEYEMSIRASIPWWPDAKRTFEINVGLEEPMVPHPGMARLIASADQPTGLDPYIEASIAQDVFAPGDVITGSVAFSNVAKNRYKGARLRIIGTERVDIGKWTKESNDRTDLEFAMPLDPVEGQAYPFRLRLPDHLPPSHQTTYWTLSYVLEIEAQRSWARDLAIAVPFTIVPRRFKTRSAPARRALPTIGSERIAAIWAEAASETGLTLEDDALRGEVTGVAVTIGRDHRGREGTFIVGELEYPPLGLDLSIQRGGRFDLLGRDDIEIGVSKWDRRHRVEARDAEQTRAFLLEVGGSLARFRTVVMSDRTLRVEVKDAGTQPGPVRAITEAIVTLARALADARRRIPPPGAMTSDVQAWTRLAEELSGTLDHVRMEVRGTTGALPVVISTEWTKRGSPLLTALEVTTEVSVERSLRLLAPDFTVLGGDPGALASAEIQDLIRRIGEHPASAITVAPNGVRVELPAPLTDFTAAVTRLRTMTQLVRALGPSAGPYR